MVSTESTKQRSLRISLDYYKRLEPLTRAKLLLAVVAALVTVGYVAYVSIAASPGHAQLAPGRVAAVHSGWNNQCSKCHQDFEAIHGNAWGMSKASFDVEKRRWSSDETCTQCHEAPHHHDIAPTSPIKVETCGGCHQDHRGTDASLVRMSDSHCTRCHHDLTTVALQAPPAHFDSSISAFYDAKSDSEESEWPHPEFRSLAKPDPGKVAFNHAIHMTRGLPSVATTHPEGRALSQYDDPIDPDYLARAVPEWDGSQTGGVQLDCLSCHEAQTSGDRQAFTTKAGKLRSISAQFAPIRFDRHCAACHKLGLGEEKLDRLPHGLQKDELEQAIHAFSNQRNLKKRNRAPSATEQFEELLGKPRGELKANDLLQQSDAILAEQRKQATRVCQKCHLDQDPFQDRIKAQIPQRWFTHARFDHSAHRQVDCQQCHPKSNTSQASSDVLIAGYATCTQCHRPVDAPPATNAWTNAKQGARSDCAECHWYHGRTPQPSGLGAGIHSSKPVSDPKGAP